MVEGSWERRYPLCVIFELPVLSALSVRAAATGYTRTLSSFVGQYTKLWLARLPRKTQLKYGDRTIEVNTQHKYKASQRAKT